MRLNGNLLEKIAPTFFAEEESIEKENSVSNYYQDSHFLSAERKNNKNRHRAGDWVCIMCNNHNYSFREVCNRCRQQTKQQNIVQSLASYQPSKAMPSQIYSPNFQYGMNPNYTTPFFSVPFQSFSEEKTPLVCNAETLKEKSEAETASFTDDQSTIFGFDWLSHSLEEQTSTEDEFPIEESPEDINRNKKLLKLFSTDN